jgi:hypothetical protein
MKYKLHVPIMKKLNNLLVLIVLFLSSCAIYDIQTTTSDEAFTKVYCKNPEYLETKTLIVGELRREKITSEKFNQNQNGDVLDWVRITPKDLTISEITSYIQSKFGKDVTISNLRWDIERPSKKIGATFDVIRCK